MQIIKKDDIIVSLTKTWEGTALKKPQALSVYSGLPKEVYIIFISKIITSMGSFIIPLYALILTQKIGMSKPDTGWMTALLTLVQSVCLLIGGKFIDRIGRKKVLCFCQITGAALYIICIFLPTDFSLAGVIMVTAGLYMTAAPAQDALLADYTKEESRKAAYSLIYFGANMGYSIGPLLSGLLFNNHLKLLFALDAVTTLVSITLITIFVREPQLQKIAEKSAELKPARFESLRFLWHTKELLFFILFAATYQFCITQWSFMMPLQMTDLYGLAGPTNFGLLTVVTAIVVVIFTPALTSATKKFRSLAIISIGGMLYSAAYFIFGSTVSFFVFIISSIILTTGEILVMVNNSSFIAAHTPPELRGRVYSVSQLTQRVFEGISPVIMGVVIVSTGYHISWYIIGSIMMLGAVAMACLNLYMMHKNNKTIIY